MMANCQGHLGFLCFHVAFCLVFLQHRWKKLCGKKVLWLNKLLSMCVKLGINTTLSGDIYQSWQGYIDVQFLFFFYYIFCLFEVLRLCQQQNTFNIALVLQDE